MLNRMTEPASGEAVEPSRDGHGRFVPCKAAIRVQVPVAVGVTFELQVRRKVLASAAGRYVTNPLAVDRTQPRFPVVVRNRAVMCAVSWRRLQVSNGGAHSQLVPKWLGPPEGRARRKPNEERASPALCHAEVDRIEHG